MSVEAISIVHTGLENQLAQLGRFDTNAAEIPWVPPFDMARGHDDLDLADFEGTGRAHIGVGPTTHRLGD
jgi:hypothetical protein